MSGAFDGILIYEIGTFGLRPLTAWRQWVVMGGVLSRMGRLRSAKLGGREFQPKLWKVKHKMNPLQWKKLLSENDLGKGSGVETGISMLPMEQDFDPSRRNFIKGTFALGTLLVAQMLKPAPAFSACSLTPPETEGPFYPVRFPLDRDNDLTWVEGGSGKARGDIIYVSGVVQDEACQPVPGALVEVWQACATGKYNHPGDRSSADLDPHFQYWGKAVTNDRGEYGFKTIKPGSYPVSWFWTRPPHIHFKVLSRNHSELTTQMYFAGEPLNARDRLLGDQPSEVQKKFIVPFHGVEDGRAGKFDLTLRKT